MNLLIEKLAWWPGVISRSLRFLLYKMRMLDQVISEDPSKPQLCLFLLLKWYEDKQLSGAATYKKFNLFQPETLNLCRFYVTTGTDAIWLCNLNLIDLQAYSTMQCSAFSK